MRYAIISDVHANEAALRAVLQDAADAGAERIVCLGDVLGYGPEPVQALELVYRRAHVCLAGNHDDAVAGRCAVDDFTEFAAAAVARHRAALAQEAVDWLRRLPYTCEFLGDGGQAAGAFACVHGDFSDPKAFNYVLEPADALPSFRARTEPLLFAGHTHRPCVIELGADGTPVDRAVADFTLEPGRRYLVNAGSVGYPRSGVCRSSYCLYDDGTRRVSFRTLPFDLEGYRAKMQGQGLDEAPWMRARSAAQGAREVRGAARFGHPDPGARRSPVRVGGRGLLLPFAGILAACIAAGACVWCTRAALRALPDRSAVPPAVAAEPEAAAAPGPAERFSDERPLANGWKGLLEFPGYQTVRIGSGARKGVATAFHMEGTRRGTVRLVKSLCLVERPPKVYWSVNLLNEVRPGKALDFAFNVRLRFLDVHGKLLDEAFASGKRSALNRWTAVPADTETAEMTVDCTCAGVYDLAVPYFKTEPERRTEAGGKKKRKDRP